MNKKRRKKKKKLESQPCKWRVNKAAALHKQAGRRWCAEGVTLREWPEAGLGGNWKREEWSRAGFANSLTIDLLGEQRWRRALAGAARRAGRCTEAAGLRQLQQLEAPSTIDGSCVWRWRRRCGRARLMAEQRRFCAQRRCWERENGREKGRVPKGAGEKRREGEMMGDFWLDLGMATI
jgi:hypothetical protein